MPVTFVPDPEKMSAVIAGMPDNKSAKIRRLAAAGYKRTVIANHLGIRYQFVYNVLTAPAPKGKRVENPYEALTVADESPARWVWVQVGRNGSIELPETFRSGLAIGEGDQVQLQLEAGAIRILTRDQALHALSNDVRQFVPEGVSLVDELISDRREELAREISRD